MSAQGLYTAPDPLPDPASVTVTATSQADSTKSASASVSLTYPAPNVSSISPNYVLVNSSDTMLTITGGGFTKVSTVSFNNNSLTTTFVSSTQLTVVLPAADASAEGKFSLAVANPSPGGGTSAAGEFDVYGAALTVNIIDLPAGTPASVTVTGPNNLNQTLTAGQTIVGAEGTYSVTATGVAVGGNTYYATTPAQTVTLAAGNSSTLTVDYYTIIPNTTKVLDQAGMQGLQVSSDGNTLTIPSSSAVAQSLHAGDILVSGPTSGAPYGLLVKVLTVVPGASTVTVTVADASLEDAIQRVNINTSFPLGSTAVAQKSTRTVNSGPTQTLSLADSCSSQPVKYSYNFDLPVTGQQDGNYVTPSKLDGWVEICPTFVFQLQMDFFKIKTLTMAVQMGEHVAINSEIGELIGISKEFDATPIPLPSFSVAVPGLPFPIWITPQLVFYASANGDVMAALSAGLAQDASIKIGASYTNGTWAPINDRSNNFGYDPPSLDGGLSIKGALGARVDFLIYRTAGPSIGVDVYSQFDANTADNPWWTWSAGIEGPIAFHVQVFGHSLADYDVGDVFNFSWVVKQANSGFLVSEVTPVLNSVLPPSAQVRSADVPLSLSGSNFVPDSIASFNGTFLPTNFIDSNDLAATLPGGLLYMDGAFPITVTNPDISGAISSPFDFSVTGAVVSVLPSVAQVPATSVQQFAAEVLGPSNTAVIWSVNGVVGGNSTVGTISASGLYTAPSAVPNPSTVAVTATSQAVPSASGSASVMIGPYNEQPVYSFTSLTDGAAPSAPLILSSDGYYYGTAQLGGAYGYGTVFKMSSSGTVTHLHDFTGTDGANPIGGGTMVQAGDGYFYGSTEWGGAYNQGTIFKMASSGALTTLYSFTGGNDGGDVGGGLVLGTDGYFYGVTFHGGAYGAGAVFQADSLGNVDTLYSFTGGADGYGPESLVLGKDGYFYGTTQNGGNSSCTAFGGTGCGTIFRIDSTGHLATLYSFSGTPDGAQPDESLFQASNGLLYGTTLFGGDPSCTVSTYTGCGTIFSISTTGSFMLIHEFSGGTEGGVPFSSLIQAGDGDFYGTATAGGDLSCSVYASNENYPTYIGCGTVFKMDTVGNVTALYSFKGSPNDGSNPFATLLEGSDGFLYGTTRWGGADTSCPYTTNGGCGTVFKVSGPGGPLPLLQTVQTSQSMTQSLNLKPLATQTILAPMIQTGQMPPPVPNVKGVPQPAMPK